ncbi:transglutaminase TgpA family protein [Paraferrimonas sedimenticola]|uniref:Transglutaminase n=1 Tax=Paraferrimonas sedimenticola TaxID=375674 RepID=A0AA37RWX1_9GAMM|nr:DUF3488 and transglutaminase-like domain-containing protein [Paraferrimonas sedimenticola]GLP96479.1 transglutaminase [Paraferrimonas sedimenticola]
MNTKVGFQTLAWLMLSQCLIMASIWQQVSPWALAITFCCWLWRVSAEAGYANTFAKALIIGVTLVLCFYTLMHMGETGLLETMANLLIMGFSLKLLELHYRRDIFALVLVGCFIIAMSCLFFNDWIHSLQASVLFILNLAVSFVMVRKQIGNSQLARHLLRMTALSLPLTLILFYLFPRVPPLWMVPKLGQSEIGLADSMSPGQITELTQSTRLAFRAQFGDELPATSQLYWRALVLEEFDGATWRQHSWRKTPQSTLTQIQAEPELEAQWQYQIWARASDNPWLYGLDKAYVSDARIQTGQDYSLSRYLSLNEDIHYSVRSYPESPLNTALSRPEHQLNLHVPEGNPKTRAFAQRLQRKYPEPSTAVTELMRHFHQQDFRYSLTPPKMQNQQQDDFLFNQKVGFCMHFASAMATVTRLMGLPSRVVLGYHGGIPKANDDGISLSVYQYMAHAWVEVYLDGVGWQRYDPTAVVSPSRINLGFDAFAEQQMQQEDRSDWMMQVRLHPLFKGMQTWAAEVDAAWGGWLGDFNAERQTQLLEHWLGDDAKTHLPVVLLTSLVLVLLFLAWNLGLFKRGPAKAPELAHYQALLKPMARLGINPAPGETPSSVLDRLAEAQPMLAARAKRFQRLFETCYYGQQSQQREALKRAQLALAKGLKRGSLRPPKGQPTMSQKPGSESRHAHELHPRTDSSDRLSD